MILAAASLAPVCLLLFIALDDRSTASVELIERRRPTLTVEPRATGGALVARGDGFQSGEFVVLYAAPSMQAAFINYVALITVTARANGSFDLIDANAQSAQFALSQASPFGSAWTLVARGLSSGAMTARPMALIDAPMPATVQPSVPTVIPTAAPPTPLPTLTPPPPPDPNAIGKWYAEFYPSRDPMPTVVYSRNESVLDNTWTVAPHPALALADFSASYSRREVFAETTSYEFMLTVNGAARMFFDDTLIIDEWHNGPRREHKVTIPVIAGEHRLRVEFSNSDGPAMLKSSWTPRVFHGWQGRYFNNNSFSGSPSLIRDDDKIEFNWDKGSPGYGLPVDNFSVKWEERVCFKAGDYKLVVDADDWVRVFMDGKPINELNTFDQGPRAREHTLRLSGCRMIEVQYIEFSESAHVSFHWEQMTPTPTP